MTPKDFLIRLKSCSLNAGNIYAKSSSGQLQSVTGVYTDLFGNVIIETI